VIHRPANVEYSDALTMLSVRRKIRAARSLLNEKGLVVLATELARRCLRIRRPGPDEIEMVLSLFSRPVDDKRRPTMIDVGAHVGNSLAPFVRLGWQVFAFEPDSHNRSNLENAFGAFSNVHIDSRGISDEPSECATFYTSHVSSGIGGLSAFHSSHVATDHIAVTTLDHFCFEHDIHNVDFLKIDTERYDLFVLRGSPWERFAPSVVVCEFENSKTVPLGYSLNDLAAFLQQRGYSLIISEWEPIQEYGGLHTWRCFMEFPCELNDSNAWGNIIAVRSDAQFRALIKICSQDGHAAL
jgi:FkbM family methyltransferase